MFAIPAIPLLVAATMAAIALPTTHVETIPKDVVYAHVGDIIPGGGTDLFVMRANGDTLLVEFDELRFVGDDLQAVLYLDLSPTVLRTTFTDAEGDVHEVVTNCASFPWGNLQECAEFHKKALAIMKKLFPKVERDRVDVDR